MVFEVGVILDVEGELVELIFFHNKILLGVKENGEGTGVAVDFGLVVEEEVFVGVLIDW
jgi:hypothetical protein